MDEKLSRIRLTYACKLLTGFSVPIVMLLAILVFHGHSMGRLSDSVSSTVAHPLEVLTVINKLHAESISTPSAQVQLSKLNEQIRGVRKKFLILIGVVLLITYIPALTIGAK